MQRAGLRAMAVAHVPTDCNMLCKRGFRTAAVMFLESRRECQLCEPRVSNQQCFKPGSVDSAVCKDSNPPHPLRSAFQRDVALHVSSGVTLMPRSLHETMNKTKAEVKPQSTCSCASTASRQRPAQHITPILCRQTNFRWFGHTATHPYLLSLIRLCVHKTNRESPPLDPLQPQSPLTSCTLSQLNLQTEWLCISLCMNPHKQQSQHEVEMCMSCAVQCCPCYCTHPLNPTEHRTTSNTTQSPGIASTRSEVLSRTCIAVGMQGLCCCLAHQLYAAGVAKAAAHTRSRTSTPQAEQGANAAADVLQQARR